jgi:hypothetical protein
MTPSNFSLIGPTICVFYFRLVYSFFFLSLFFSPSTTQVFHFSLSICFVCFFWFLLYFLWCSLFSLAQAEL